MQLEIIRLSNYEYGNYRFDLGNIEYTKIPRFNFILLGQPIVEYFFVDDN